MKLGNTSTGNETVEPEEPTTVPIFTNHDAVTPQIPVTTAAQLRRAHERGTICFTRSIGKAELPLTERSAGSSVEEMNTASNS